MPREKVSVGDVYIQYTRIDVGKENPEYIVVNKVDDESFEFTLYYKWDDHLMTSGGEGHINQLLEGLQEGDIIKSDDKDLQGFICLCRLLEA